MNTIILANHPITYHVAYQKNRKTIELKVVSGTHLEIIAPKNLPKASIEEILHKKSNWIVKKIIYWQSMAANPINKSIIPGAAILYLGTPYTLVFNESLKSPPAVTLGKQEIIIHTPLTKDVKTKINVESFLRQWYIENAKSLLSTKTSLWASQIGVQPQRITIKDQKTRWGSCSSKGNINYNWRIIMAPPEVIDYLVIHELCHLRVLNHSALFWQTVSTFSPNYKIHRAWLKTNGTLLMGMMQNNF